MPLHPNASTFLNRSASGFFRIVQDVLADDIQLTLSKLGGPPRTMGHTNLTLSALLKEIRTAGESELAKAVKAYLDTFHQLCSNIIQHRNKRIAHYDLGTMTAGTASPLPDVSRQDVERALETVRLLMNSVESHFENSSTAYEHFAFSGYDGEALIGVLKQGLRYEQLVSSELISWDDLAKFS
jgi:hypothetical protein